MERLLGAALPNLAETVSLLAFFSVAMLRSQAWPELPFLSGLQGMGSLESGVRRWSVPQRRC